MGKWRFSSRATTSSRNSCEYISSSRRDCSIISISRVNRATPRPVTWFSRHRSACTYSRGESNNAAPLETYKRRGRAEGRVTALSPREGRRKGNRAPGRKTKGGVASITRKSLASKGGRGARSRLVRGPRRWEWGTSSRCVRVLATRTERIRRIWNMIVEP